MHLINGKSSVDERVKHAVGGTQAEEVGDSATVFPVEKGESKEDDVVGCPAEDESCYDNSAHSRRLFAGSLEQMGTDLAVVDAIARQGR